jgi:hypothetical protein
MEDSRKRWLCIHGSSEDSVQIALTVRCQRILELRAPAAYSFNKHQYQPRIHGKRLAYPDLMRMDISPRNVQGEIVEGPASRHVTATVEHVSSHRLHHNCSFDPVFAARSSIAVCATVSMDVWGKRHAIKVGRTSA